MALDHIFGALSAIGTQLAGRNIVAMKGGTHLPGRNIQTDMDSVDRPDLADDFGLIAVLYGASGACPSNRRSCMTMSCVAVATATGRARFAPEQHKNTSNAHELTKRLGPGFAVTGKTKC